MRLPVPGGVTVVGLGPVAGLEPVVPGGVTVLGLGLLTGMVREPAKIIFFA